MICQIIPDAQPGSTGNFMDLSLVNDPDFPIGTEVVCEYPAKKSSNSMVGGKLRMNAVLKGRVVGLRGTLLVVRLTSKSNVLFSKHKLDC